MKIVAIIMLAIATTACIEKNPADKNASQQTVKPAPADFYRAALLNIDMGKTYLAQGQTTRAKQKFVHALELKPKLPEAHSAIAYFYETVGDISEAEKHHSQALSYGAGKARFYNNYGTFLCRQGRYNEADQAFNSALKDKQYINTAEVYENAGLCALQHQDLKKAYMYFHSALQHDPTRALARSKLAGIELNNER